MDIAINNNNATAIDKYWDDLKNLSDSTKRALISRLKKSLSPSKVSKKSVNLEGIVGLWASEGYPTEESIRSLRKSHHNIIEFHHDEVSS